MASSESRNSDLSFLLALSRTRTDKLDLASLDRLTHLSVDRNVKRIILFERSDHDRDVVSYDDKHL